MYADDTNIFLHHKDPNILLKNAQIGIEDMTNWLVANKLTFNIEETKFMLFNLQKQNKNLTCNNLVINGFSIQRVHNIKFLGLHLDENLS